MGKTINLTKVTGCYSKELLENEQTIKRLLMDYQVTLYTMRHAVLDIVAPATVNAEAKARFISKLKQCRTKSAIYKLCSDAIIHGMYYHPAPTPAAV